VPCAVCRAPHSALGTRHTAHRAPHSALSPQPSAVSRRPSAVGTPRAALGPRHTAHGTPRAALGPRPSALGTRHTAHRAPHPALSPRFWLRPSTPAVAQSHRQTDGDMSTPVRLERATEDSATEVARSGAHAQFRCADDSAHIRSTCSLAAERGPEGCAEHPDPGSRRPRATHVSFEPLPRTSPPLRTLEGVGGLMPALPPPGPVLDSSVGSQCSPLRRSDFRDRRRRQRREIDQGRTLPARPNFGGEYHAPLLTTHTTSRSPRNRAYTLSDDAGAAPGARCA